GPATRRPRIIGRAISSSAATLNSRSRLCSTGWLRGVVPQKARSRLMRSVPEDGSFQIIAEFPDGRVEPLLWLEGYKKQFTHVFLFRAPIELPAGTTISVIPAGSSIVLLPAIKE